VESIERYANVMYGWQWCVVQFIL